MNLLEKHKKIIGSVIGAAVFVLSILVVLFYLYKRCRGEFNADFTDTILWADAAVRSGKYCNPDYWYAYFLPFSGIPIMIPIVKIFGLSYFSHQLGMTVFLFIFAASLFIFFKACDCSVWEALTLSGLTVIFMCASQVTRMIFYGHIIHYSLVIVFMCISFCFLKKSTLFEDTAGGGASKKAKIYTVIIAIWLMLCCTNGMATLILYFAPFVGCIILERFIDKRPITYSGDRSLIHTVAIFAAGGLAGYIIKMIFFASSEYENSITALLPADGWVWKQSPFLLEWIKVLTGDSTGDVQMMTFDGIRILGMYFMALVILIVPVFALISYRKIESRMLRLTILYYWLMFATTMLTYSVSYALVSNWRLAGLVCAAVMTTLLYTLYMIKSRRNVRWFMPLIPVFAVCALLCMLSVKNLPSAINTNETDQLIEIYKANGLTRGYASSFWNSTNSANVLSDGEITVSPIFIYPDGSYEVRKYQSEPSGYEDVPGVERYFVVVDSNDIEYASDTLGAHKVDEIKFQDNLYIWVFDRNIFDNLEPVF